MKNIAHCPSVTDYPKSVNDFETALKILEEGLSNNSGHSLFWLERAFELARTEDEKAKCVRIYHTIDPEVLGDFPIESVSRFLWRIRIAHIL